ncbi:hypothetical protein BK127_28135 [Paenibacillus sp. FSL H7-0331]|nr:hypothetical protein BK127_28135 [Paenibacillus sp. FSL H7-0331]
MIFSSNGNLHKLAHRDTIIDNHQYETIDNTTYKRTNPLWLVLLYVDGLCEHLQFFGKRQN